MLVLLVSSPSIKYLKYRCRCWRVLLGAATTAKNLAWKGRPLALVLPAVRLSGCRRETCPDLQMTRTGAGSCPFGAKNMAGLAPTCRKQQGLSLRPVHSARGDRFSGLDAVMVRG